MATLDEATLRAAIEAESLENGRGVDWLACWTTRQVWAAFGDGAFDWLIDRALSLGSRGKALNYYWVLGSIGYDSDGFSPEFSTRAFRIVSDSSAPLEARLSCAEAALRWPHVFYRPPEVYQKMAAIAAFVNARPALHSVDYPLQSEAPGCLEALARRTRALEQLQRGLIRIPAQVLGARGARGGASPEQLREFGLPVEDGAFMRNFVALVLAWGVHRGPQRPDALHATGMDVRSPRSLRRGRAQVLWAPLPGGEIEVAALSLQISPEPKAVPCRGEPR